MNINSSTNQPLIHEAEKRTKRRCIIYSAVVVVALLVLVFVGIKTFSSDPIPQMESWNYQVDMDELLGVSWYPIAANYGFEDIDFCSDNFTMTIQNGQLVAKRENKYISQPQTTFGSEFYYGFEHLDTNNTKFRLKRAGSSWWSESKYIYIIAGSVDYSDLLLFEPNTKLFSILSKTPTINKNMFIEYINKLKVLMGFSKKAGIQVIQSCA